MLKDDMATLIAHLNVTIKHLTRYKQKIVLAAILEGKSMPSNMAANISLKCVSSQISGVREFL